MTWQDSPMLASAGKVDDRELADALGCSVASICLHRKKHNIPSHRDTSRQCVIRLLDDHTPEEVAGITGMSVTAVSQRRRRSGLPSNKKLVLLMRQLVEEEKAPVARCDDCAHADHGPWPHCSLGLSDLTHQDEMEGVCDEYRPAQEARTMEAWAELCHDTGPLYHTTGLGMSSAQDRYRTSGS